MEPSKREASSPVSPTSEKPSKKHRPLDYGGPTTEAPAAITPHGPLRNRHLQAVINAAAAADGADHSLSNRHHHHHQKGHHTPITTTITQVFNNSSLSSPITVTSNSNSSTPNNLNVSKRRSIVNLNRPARKDLTSYATKEGEMTSSGGGGGTPGTPNDQHGDEAPTPTLSRVEYKNNLKSLHEIMSKSFDPKRAFNYNFINIMSSFINNDQGSIDFKLIALSLDAGTRVWTSKVDLVYRNTQKVSNSLSMATGDEKAGGGANFEDEEGLFENSFLRKEKKKAAAKKRRKMAPTIVANTDTINGKLEMNIAVDPLFHHFSAAFDVGNVNSMLMTNLASDPSGVLLLDSAEMLNFDDAYKQQEKQPQPPTTVDLSAFNITLGSGGRQRDLESEEYGGGITVCPPMGDFDITNFSFNDRDASIEHLLSGSLTSPGKSSAFPATGGPYSGGQGRPSFEFDIDAPVDDVDVGDDDDYGGDHDGGDGGGHHSGDEDGGGCGAHGKDHHPQANQLYNQLDASLLEASMMDILPANKNEFFNKNFLRQVFRKVPFFKQGAGRSLLDGPGLDEKTADGSSAAAEAKKTARPKRTRPTFEENTYAASKDVLEELFKPPTQEVKDSVSVARPTLNRWAINSERKHLKDDYGFKTRHLKALFAKPDTYFNDLRELKEQLGGGGATTSGAAGASVDDYGDDDHDFGAGGGGSGGGGSSDYEGDEVGGGGGTGAEDYIYERPLPDFNIDDDYRSQAQSGATGGEPKLNGHVDPLDIDYCRVAKKVNMKRVKRGMWKIIKKSTTTELLSTDDPSQPASEAASSGGLQSGSHGLTFSSLRQILPNHIGPNLNENLSVHTSFVALLHLCNDKDLALAPITADDHSDFVIMKPTAAD